jgi:quercetin dioxygenase-like cupin family protein
LLAQIEAGQANPSL